MKLEILMGTNRSHSAYRIAWENSFGERIPFLPLLRRDLVAAAEGNKTFVDQNTASVNWKKFAIMGEVIVEIQKVLNMPFTTLHGNSTLRSLVFEGSLIKDDDVCSLRYNLHKLRTLFSS